MRVLYFGTYSVGPGYPRNTVLIESLRAAGADVKECRAPLFRGAGDKVATASSLRGALSAAARGLVAWASLAARFPFAGPRDVLIVGYTGHLDLFLARALSLLWRRPIVLDAFLSLHDTVVGDRKLLAHDSLAARGLYAFERTALSCADLVLTDTAAGAEFLATSYDLPRRRFVALPVGSLVRAPARAAAPVADGGGCGGDMQGERTFTALFVGSFVPLQGVPYLLDAARLAPELRFVIVGDGPDGARIEEEVARRNMPNVTLRRKFMPKEELAPLYAEADAVLGVFGSSAKAARVIPCKVYDGLCAGRPVVTGDSPAARELLTDGLDALLVDRGDPRSLVRALRRLASEPALGERLRAGALRLARTRLSREAIGLQLKAALAEVVRA